VKCSIPSAIVIEPFCHPRSVTLPIAMIAAVNMALDFYILGIVVNRMRGLNVSKAKKVGLIAIFGVGSLYVQYVF
jgi:hypothetical protein